MSDGPDSGVTAPISGSARLARTCRPLFGSGMGIAAER